ncbi:L1 [Leptonychotes weddellii papillomavirus 4]|uniref:Major capsid protein L1 n=1 Tax=Leptonychotes weddellii papillomavirus 4 TaxID=2077305 RepID=A0A2I8B2R4_9PAPI|nr:L1 [Leptonychotes weddellii papillomavirus 4]AUT11928.1 L1 [Leptonychotes weddellii papillomavirus 4]
MAFWTASGNKLYLPPTPVTKTSSTDAYVIRTNVYYHANSERLLTVGHPYYEIRSADEQTVEVPKVSCNQYRVFRIRFPDPNKFALADQSIFNPETERLVWAMRGVEIGRGQPLGIGLTGHPLFNRYDDTENPRTYMPDPVPDGRQNVSSDTKQTQLFILGCAPPLGEHWAPALRCDPKGDEAPAPRGSCPPLELVSSVIEDGDMIDIGYGAMDFNRLQDNKSDAPLDINTSICKYTDYIRMGKDTYGDHLFFYGRREQMYTRHFFNRNGTVGDAVPGSKFLVAKAGRELKPSSSVYFGSPSGSLVSSDSQLFNRPYWLMRAQGQNNGICWENQAFVTVVDTTRGTNFNLSVLTTEQKPTDYDASKYKNYLRHVEEYELSFILQLCKVPLTPDVLANIYTMNPDVLEDWNLGVNPPPSATLEDTYRYLKSLATPCPDKVQPFIKMDSGHDPGQKRALRIANSVASRPAKKKRK